MVISMRDALTDKDLFCYCPESTFFKDATNKYAIPRPGKLPFDRDDIARFRKYNSLTLVGIGGSYIGMKMLDEFCSGFMTPEWNGSIQYARTSEEFSKLDTTGTLFVVTSKSGKTPETIEIFNTLPSRDVVFQGAGPEGVESFPIEEHVGGRFSIWNTLLPFAIKFGYDAAENFLQEGIDAKMLVNFSQTASRLASLSANHENKCVLVYDSTLVGFVEYYQQLFMESLGKDGSSSGVMFGGYGPGMQHSTMQHVHGSFMNIPTTFVLVEKDSPTDADFQLWANAKAQAAALANNQNKTKSVFVTVKQSTASLAKLITLIEMEVLTLATLFNINPFDQPGVELGKTIATSNLKILRESKMELRDFLEL